VVGLAGLAIELRVRPLRDITPLGPRDRGACLFASDGCELGIQDSNLD
jgi:hypothetical protein